MLCDYATILCLLCTVELCPLKLVIGDWDLIRDLVIEDLGFFHYWRGDLGLALQRFKIWCLRFDLGFANYCIIQVHANEVLLYQLDNLFSKWPEQSLN